MQTFVLLLLLVSPLKLFCNDEQWHGEGYNKNSSEQRYAASVWIEKLNFNDDEQILDVGCGDGYNTHLLALKPDLRPYITLEHSRT